ncbi:MAG TPA: hypothetical protein VK816_03260 [Jatrophihabitantaceae bacterium]|nr:hypothetical protein [Jatrophihabitantaceae bacterium]
MSEHRSEVRARSGANAAMSARAKSNDLSSEHRSEVRARSGANAAMSARAKSRVHQ